MATVLSFERHPVAPPGAAGLRELLGRLVDDMRSAPGVLWAEMAPVAGGDACLVLSEWRTEADLDAFESGEVASSYDQAADAYRTADPTRRRFLSG